MFEKIIHRTKNSVKKQVAKILSFAMLINTIVSAGAALNLAHASSTAITYNGFEDNEAMVRRGLEIIASAPAYSQGARTGPNSYDCSGLVDSVIRDIYGSTTSAPIGWTNGWGWDTSTWVQFIQSGQSVQIGNTIYTPTTDIEAAHNAVGAILAYDGHMALSIGNLGSADAATAKAALESKYGVNLDGATQGSSPLAKVAQLASYSTWRMDARSTVYGVGVGNNRTGKSAVAPFLGALIPSGKVSQDGSITIKKVDANNTNKTVSGAKYGLYSDSSCTQQILTFKTTTSGYRIDRLNYGTYYIKEISAPTGYALSSKVTKIEITAEDNGTITLTDDPVSATVAVDKKDAHSNTALSSTKFKLQEWSYAKNAYQTITDLSWDGSRFTLPSSYKSYDGLTHTDKKLYYTQDNGGAFKIYEETAQNGYTNAGYSKEFSIIKGNLDLTGSSAVTNTANLAVKVVKKDTNGNPVADVEFKLEYNGQSYRGKTGSTGEVIFKNIPEGNSLSAKLTELSAPEGYLMDEDFMLGKTIALEKNSVSDNCFMTTVAVTNQQVGKIKIHKADGSRIDDFNTGVADTYYSIFTDEALTTIAKDVNGKELSMLKTDVNGNIETDWVMPGAYFIREMQAPNGYAIQNRTFAVNVNGGAKELEVETRGVNDLRQRVVLSIQKSDEKTGVGVANAVYAMYADSELRSCAVGKTIAVGTLLGYYKTDENGLISTYTFGTDALIGDDGVEYPAVVVKTADGTELQKDNLPNGTYHFEEVSAANGYTLNAEKIVIDASWQDNKTEEEVAGADGTVGANGECYTVNTKTTKEVRQKAILTLNKKDAEKGANTANAWYQLNGYTGFVESNLVATLGHAEYYLYTESDVKDIDTGAVIAAHTLIGIYQTDANGQIVANTMTEGDYAGHAIPNGTYSMVENKAPKGYVLDSMPIIFDVTWTSGGQNETPIMTVEKAVDHNEFILKQAINVHKVTCQTANGANALPGIGFEIYRVADVLETNGLTSTDELPWDTDSIKQRGFYGLKYKETAELLKNTKPAVDDEGNSKFVTNQADGEFTTGKFIYGDYILFESDPNEDYNVADAVYLRLPWIENDEETDWEHGINYQPESPLNEIVVNKMGKAYVSIEKVDSTTGERITLDVANFEIYDKDNEKVIQNIGAGSDRKQYGDPWTTGDEGYFITAEPLYSGTYTIKEIKTPTGYATLPSGITLKITANGAQATLADGTDVSITYSMENKIPVVQMTVKNDPIQTIVTKYEESDDSVKSEVKGAVLQILNEDGTVAENAYGEKCEWNTETADTDVDADGIPAHLIKYLPAGSYILHEAKTPDGYATAEDVTFTLTDTADIQYVSMKDEVIKIQTSKIDAESEAYLPGATLEIQDANGNTAKNAKGNELTWTTGKEDSIFEYVPVGQYQLVEKETPEGYVTADPISFEVKDTAELQIVETMKDARAYGQLTIKKSDSVTKEPLNGVEFELRYAEDVVNPATQEVLSHAGDVAAKLVTDENGTATTEKLPIATYGEDGLVAYITYELVETKAADGQYAPCTITDKIVFKQTAREDLVSVTMDLTNDKPIVTVEKHGVKPTFEGKYDDRENITVVQKDDLLQYNIKVSNTGAAPAYNIVVKDAIPENSEFISIDDGSDAEYIPAIPEIPEISAPATDDSETDKTPDVDTDSTTEEQDSKDSEVETERTVHGYYDEKTNTIYWELDQLNVAETVVLSFTVKVTSDKPCEIVNMAQYAYPNQIPETEDDLYDPTNPDNPWIDTDCVIYQTVDIEKTASIDYGKNKDDAVEVKIGDTFDYIITMTTVDPVYGATITDPIPEGLNFILGSATFKTGDTEKKFDDVIYDEESHTITFPEVDLEAGESTWTFTVQVAELNKTGETVYYINQAEGSVKERLEEDGETPRIPLKTDTVSHKAEMPKPDPTPDLPTPDAPHTGDSALPLGVWVAISAASMVSMLGFGIYGFGKKRIAK